LLVRSLRHFRVSYQLFMLAGCLFICLFICLLAAPATAATQEQSPFSDLRGQPPVGPAGVSLQPPPLFTIVGYEQREEYIQSESEWKKTLGVGGYRQSVASRVLLIIGGLATFGGTTALLATFGSLGDNTAYGSQSLPGASSAYQAYVYGFSGMLAAGAAILLTGLVLALPLPPRHRPLLIPRLQPVSPWPSP
jgi:hypothetical protein